MRKLLLLFAILITSCAKEDTNEIPVSNTPEEIAGEAAKKESDSLIDIYGTYFETNGVLEVEFLFEENDNTYLAGKANDDIWIGVFNDNLSNEGEATFDIEQSSDYSIHSRKYKLLDQAYFFSVFISNNSESLNPPHTRFIIKHDLLANNLKGFKQQFEADHGNEVIDLIKGYNDGYLFNTSATQYVWGSPDIIFINSNFEDFMVWGGKSDCFPRSDYPNFSFVNEEEYFYHNAESYFTYVHMDECEKWEIAIEGIFDFGGCIGCDYSIEVLEYSNTEVKLKANLNNDVREVILNSSSGEIISNTEV